MSTASHPLPTPKARRYPARLTHDGDELSFPDEAARAAFASLRESGPTRFSQVTDRLYRGGQPNEHDLERLRVLGVQTVISLRREKTRLRRAEKHAVTRLGMRFLSFPYYGVFGGSKRFYGRILAALREPQHGIVYLHCEHGRDRTSLLVALHLVLDDGWPPDVAWQCAVLDYDHAPTFWYSEVRSDFEKMVREGLPGLREGERG